MPCFKCGADDSEFNRILDRGQIVCGKCNYVQQYIQDDGLGQRIFNDNPNQGTGDRTGEKLEKAQATKEKARTSAMQICTFLGIDQTIVIDALQIYEQYRKNCESFKSLRSRNVEVIMAACIYAQLELQLVESGEKIKMDNPKLYNTKNKLVIYCTGKGRNTKTSAFEQQLDDLARFIDFNALSSVETYISEVRVQLDWPQHVANNVNNLRIIFKDEETNIVKKQKRLSIQMYTALLFFLTTCDFKHGTKNHYVQGISTEHQTKLCNKFGMSVDYFRGEAERMICSKRQLVADIFDKIEEDRKHKDNALQ